MTSRTNMIKTTRREPTLPHVRRTGLAGLAVGAVFLTGCVSKVQPPAPPPATSAPATTPPSSLLQPPPAAPGPPVLAVKIDNAPEARPAKGLGAADLVYIEPVE